MSHKHNSKEIDDEIFNGTIEAGQTLGMSLETVLNKYLNKRNDLLQLLRVYTGLPYADMAARLGITVEELKTLENSNELIPFQLVPKIAKAFNLNLKTLLLLLGHAKPDSIVNKEREFSMAAQYSGPDLTKQEKIDLEELFKTILENIKNKKKNQFE